MAKILKALKGIMWMLELKLREASVSERNVMSGALLVARIASDLMTNSVQQNLA